MRKDPVPKIEWVSPRMAQEWLEIAPPNPRWKDKKWDEPHARKLARDMEAGRFPVMDPIHIDGAGKPINGYHRLRAIVLYGHPVKMLVMYGCDRSVIGPLSDNTDRITKSMAASAHASGMDWVDKAIAAMLRVLHGGMRRGPSDMTTQEKMDFAEEHKEALVFTRGLFPGARKGISLAPIMGCFARAYYHVPHGILAEAAEIMYSGFTTDTRYAGIIRLREWVFRQDGYGGAVFASECYAKTARALLAAHEGEMIKSLYAVKEDPFPLP